MLKRSGNPAIAGKQTHLIITAFLFILSAMLPQAVFPQYVQPKYPAFLSIEELKFIEPSGNQSLDGLETGKITFDLVNKGKGDAFGIEVKLVLYSEDPEAYDNLGYNWKTTIEKINSKSSQTIEIAMTADSKTQSRDRIFRIEVTEYFGFDADPTYISFTTTAIPQPDLRIVQTVIDDDEEGDSYGNDNSLIEPGESIEITVVVQNFGDGSAEDVKAEVFIQFEGEGTEDYSINISYPDAGQIYSLGDFSVEQTKEFKFYFFTNRRYSSVNLPLYVNLTESKGEFGKTIDLGLQVDKPIDGSTLVWKDGLYYAPGSYKPYSGVANYTGGAEVQGGYSHTYKDGKRHGLNTEWYLNGQKQSEITWKDGEIDGKWTAWHENGQKEYEGTYKDGKEDGKWTYWSPDGKEISELIYKDGKKDGKWTDWYENGQKSDEQTFKDGKHDGLFTYWYKNGQKMYEATYKNGKRISSKCWVEDGSIVGCEE
jgi:antitoxin component YwqK of YwqJK toxin-antitoxin module